MSNAKESSEKTKKVFGGFGSAEGGNGGRPVFPASVGADGEVA